MRIKFDPHKKCKRTRMGILWKMLVIILVFILAFSFAMWIFQMQMLNYSYQGAKYRELDKTVEKIKEQNNDSLKLDETVKLRSEATYDDIWIYKIENGTISVEKPLIFTEGYQDTRSVFLQKEFDDLYGEAKSNDGHYIGVFSSKHFTPDSYYQFNIIKDNKGAPSSTPFVSRNLDNIEVIRLDVIESEGAESILLVQHSRLTPTEALVKTVEMQVLVTALLLAFFAIILAIVLSRVITKPIVKINKAAKSLANGKYDVEFNGDNYREISELSDTLNYAANELSKNDALKKELISNVSHDLRTPLTMIRGYSELMRDFPEENTPENFQIIIDEATRLSDLVSSMLDLSKLQSGVRVPERALYCITDAIKNVLERYEKLIAQEKYKIEFLYEREAFVFADSDMILQVLYNFINNAVNYTGEDKYVRVEQEVSDGKVRISITDSGDGISEDDIPYIWDRYYKIDKVHRRAQVGSGLGLSIVKGILEAHGASYGVTSEVGSGSTFWFELELANPNEYNVEVLNY